MNQWPTLLALQAARREAGQLEMLQHSGFDNTWSFMDTMYKVVGNSSDGRPLSHAMQGGKFANHAFGYTMASRTINVNGTAHVFNDGFIVQVNSMIVWDGVENPDRGPWTHPIPFQNQKIGAIASYRFDHSGGGTGGSIYSYVGLDTNLVSTQYRRSSFLLTTYWAEYIAWGW